MKSYKKLESKDGSFLKKINAQLVKKHGSVCQGCLKRTWAPQLNVYVIDDEKPAEGENLVLLDAECRESIEFCVRMLWPTWPCGAPKEYVRPAWHKWVYGGQRNPMKDGKTPKRKDAKKSSRPRKKIKGDISGPDHDIYDPRAGEGTLNARTSYGSE